jgi:hypothetical protein
MPRRATLMLLSMLCMHAWVPGAVHLMPSSQDVVQEHQGTMQNMQALSKAMAGSLVMPCLEDTMTIGSKHAKACGLLSDKYHVQALHSVPQPLMIPSQKKL